MRIAALILVVPILATMSCARREATGSRPANAIADRRFGGAFDTSDTSDPSDPSAPTALGGGPVLGGVPAVDARLRIARARCVLASACSGEDLDACITREEASLAAIHCAEIEHPRLDLCVERTRARSCTDPAARAECAPGSLCPKEEHP